MKLTMIEICTYKVRLYCDCGGNMIWNNISLDVNPPLYPHFCTDCNRQETRIDVYPTETTVEVGEEKEIALED